MPAAAAAAPAEDPLAPPPLPDLLAFAAASDAAPAPVPEAAAAAAHSDMDDDDDDDIGPQLPPGGIGPEAPSGSGGSGGGGGGGSSGALLAVGGIGGFGGGLRPGEGAAMAAYMEAGQRVPRRGEVGWSGDTIDKLQNLGYVMSGSRHKRMNEVRLRKENQVYSAAEKRALAMHKIEEKLARDAAVTDEFRALVAARTGGGGGGGDSGGGGGGAAGAP